LHFEIAPPHTTREREISAIYAFEKKKKMSHYDSDSSLGSFDPFAIHAFTAVSASAPSADGAYQGGSIPNTKTSSPSSSAAATAAGASLPSPPPSPSHKPIGYSYETSDNNNNSSGNVSIPGLRLGPTSSYNDHVARAMNAPPQSILAIPNLPAPSSSWPDINGLSLSSTLPLSMSSSSSSESSSSASSSQSQSPAPYYTYSQPPHAHAHSTGRHPNAIQPAGTHVFTDFRAEVERYRNAQTLGESDDLPVFKKKRDRTYAGF
jgi:hypothetical protein